MRFYVSGNWGWGVIWGLEGSVFPRATAIALPNAVIALLLSLHIDPPEADEDLAKNAYTLLGSFTGVLFFVLYFRSNVAYSRWWEGGTLLQQTRGEWFNAYSSLIAFSTTDPKMADKVEEFHHMLARLVSLLFSAALQQVSPDRETPFEILDTQGIEPESLRFLSESSDKVEVLLQWIQRSTIMNMYTGVLPIPPPVMSRAFQEISRGIVNLQNARKIADFPFPFPYAQTSVVMLLIHWAVTPILASMLLEPVLATILCFCLIFFVWCINFIALQLEYPFGHGENDLPMQQFQSDWNKSVGTLLARRAQHPPRFDFDKTFHRRLETVMSDGNKPAVVSTFPSHWLADLDPVNRLTRASVSSSKKLEKPESRGNAVPNPKGRSSVTQRDSTQMIGNRSVKATNSIPLEKGEDAADDNRQESERREGQGTDASYLASARTSVASAYSKRTSFQEPLDDHGEPLEDALSKESRQQGSPIPESAGRDSFQSIAEVDAEPEPQLPPIALGEWVPLSNTTQSLAIFSSSSSSCTRIYPSSQSGKVGENGAENDALKARETVDGLRPERNLSPISSSSTARSAIQRASSKNDESLAESSGEQLKFNL